MKNTDIHRLLSRYYETWAGINAAYDRIAARCGVTSNVLYLLDTLYCAEAPMTQSEIGARLGLPKQTVASMVSTLERRGYVVREVAKDDHRRRHDAHHQCAVLHRQPAACSSACSGCEYG